MTDRKPASEQGDALRDVTIKGRKPAIHVNAGGFAKICHDVFQLCRDGQWRPWYDASDEDEHSTRDLAIAFCLQHRDQAPAAAEQQSDDYQPVPLKVAGTAKVRYKLMEKAKPAQPAAEQGKDLPDAPGPWQRAGELVLVFHQDNGAASGPELYATFASGHTCRVNGGLTPGGWLQVQAGEESSEKQLARLSMSIVKLCHDNACEDFDYIGHYVDWLRRKLNEAEEQVIKPNSIPTPAPSAEGGKRLADFGNSLLQSSPVYGRDIKRLCDILTAEGGK